VECHADGRRRRHISQSLQKKRKPHT
jgi:hypothetical protein